MTSSQEPVPSYWRETAWEPVHIVLRIRLENGVSLLFDDRAGCGYGSDGATYYPICREVDGEVEVLGWSREATGETVL